MKMQKGFTLMEVMIVVVVVAILASVGIPIYSDYVIRGKLVQATSGLSEGRIKMEQYFQDFRTYAGGEVRCPAETEFFTFNCGAPTATLYTITATGKDNLAAYSYSINQDNVRSSNTPMTNPPGVNVSCWIMKSGDAC